ncbi:MAG: hypothetical protein WCG80_12175 [Spirochaetales bacterium]
MKTLPILLAPLLLASCVTMNKVPWTPPPALPAQAVPGTLLEGTDLERRSGPEAGQLLNLLSSWTLGLQINTSMLAAEGLDAWRDSRLNNRVPVRAVRLRFVALTPQGEPDLQSGLLLLPTPSSGPTPLDWVIYDRGSELQRATQPSRLANDEIELGWLLASLNHAVWMPDYGGVGDSPGQQHYCLTPSLAASSLDGLEAARAWVKQNTGDTESGRLRVLGYSEGGLATMATLKAWSENPAATPGLTLTDAYPLGAPLNLTLGVENVASGKQVLTHPHYTLLLALGWARAYPDLVRPEEIFRPEIVQNIVPLLDGEHSREQVQAAVTKLVGKPVGTVASADVFRADYLQKLGTDPMSLPYYRLQQEARLDTWVAPTSVRVTLAASPADLLVSPENAKASLAAMLAADPRAPVRALTLASGTHALAGVEALVYAIMDVDRRTTAP